MRGFTRSLVITTLAVGIIVGTGFITGTFAFGTYDQTPPSLTVPKRPSFVVGNIVTRGPGNCGGDVEYTYHIWQSMAWSATDNVGVTSYDLVVNLTSGPPTELLTHTQQTQYIDTYWGNDDNGGCGGGVMDAGYAVTARDGAAFGLGNATIKAMPAEITATQEDGRSLGDMPPAGTFAFTGAWAPASGDGFSGGTAARSTTRGNRMTFTRTYDKGGHVALVMSQGPGRGVIAIRIDNRWLVNLDTYAAADTDRVVVFEREMPAGTHTIAIVNQATPGRPEVILDAVLTN